MMMMIFRILEFNSLYFVCVACVVILSWIHGWRESDCHRDYWGHEFDDTIKQLVILWQQWRFEGDNNNNTIYGVVWAVDRSLRMSGTRPAFWYSPSGNLKNRQMGDWHVLCRNFWAYLFFWVCPFFRFFVYGNNIYNG